MGGCHQAKDAGPYLLSRSPAALSPTQVLPGLQP